MSCSKCLNEVEIAEKYSHFDGSDFKHFGLCAQCAMTYKSYQTLLFLDFMKDDFGKFPIDRTDKDIINARIKRNTGQSPWNKTQMS